MKPRNLYLILCVAGAAVPLFQVLTFLRQHGMDFRLLLDQLLSAWFIGLFRIEFIVSFAALSALVYFEGRRARMIRLWVPVAATLAVGVSLGLPLFLYMREARLQGSMWAGGRCEV
jgi:hypothetical protein